MLWSRCYLGLVTQIVLIFRKKKNNSKPNWKVYDNFDNLFFLLKVRYLFLRIYLV